MFKQISIIGIERGWRIGSHLIFDEICSPLSGIRSTVTLDGFIEARRNKENLCQTSWRALAGVAQWIEHQPAD